MAQKVAPSHSLTRKASFLWLIQSFPSPFCLSESVTLSCLLYSAKKPAAKWRRKKKKIREFLWCEFREITVAMRGSRCSESLHILQNKIIQAQRLRRIWWKQLKFSVSSLRAEATWWLWDDQMICLQVKDDIRRCAMCVCWKASKTCMIMWASLRSPLLTTPSRYFFFGTISDLFPAAPLFLKVTSQKSSCSAGSVLTCGAPNVHSCKLDASVLVCSAVLPAVQALPHWQFSLFQIGILHLTKTLSKITQCFRGRLKNVIDSILQRSLWLFWKCK